MQINRKTIIISGIIIIAIIVALIFLFPKKKNNDLFDISSPVLPTPGEQQNGAVVPTPFPPEEIDTKTPPSLIAEKIEYETNKRDSDRISKISLMAGVLMSYVGEAGDPKSYPPYPTALKWVNLSDKTSAVYKKLKSIAEVSSVGMPNVFDVIDPLHPNYYYGYRSLGGKTCELSIRLEAQGELYKGLCDPSIKEICVYIHNVERPVDDLPNAPST